MSSADTTDAPEEVVDRDERLEALLGDVSGELGDAVVGSFIRPGRGLWVRVATEAWATAAGVAKDKLGFEFFDFVSAIDWLPSPFGRDMDSQEDVVVHGAEPKEPVEMTTGQAGGDTRFQVLARVYDVRRGIGLILKADVPDETMAVESWVPHYAGANWHERETCEMFGITFLGHPDLSHIYLPTGFEGHPLRKDFPLVARRVKPWPGIVDVEPMPGDGEEADGEGEAST